MNSILRYKLEKLDKLLYSKENSINNLEKFWKKYREIFKGVRNSGFMQIPVEDLTFHRVRIWEENRPWETLEEMWFPPKSLFIPGRLNNPHQRLLYASIDENTALIEKSPSENTCATILSFKVKPDKIQCLELGLNSISDEQRAFHNPKDKFLHNYISKKCKKRVSEKNLHHYIPTIIYSNAFEDANFDAFVYDSVKAKFTGENFAFNPEFIKKNMIFKMARNVLIKNKTAEDDFEIHCLSLSKEIIDNKFIYEDISKCKGHNITTQIDFNYKDH